MDLDALAHPIFIITAAGTLIGIFLRGAAHKFLHFPWFVHTLAEYRILPSTLSAPAAGLLLASEVALTLGLGLPQTRAFAAFASAALVGLYGIAVAVNLLRGRTRIDCGCGDAGNGLSWFHVLRNAALIGFALVAAQSPSSADTGPLDWVVGLAAIASFWLLLAGGEKLAENWSYLAASSARRHEIEMETH
jgi:Methylamine utilisation protein MauE